MFFLFIILFFASFAWHAVSFSLSLVNFSVYFDGFRQACVVLNHKYNEIFDISRIICSYYGNFGGLLYFFDEILAVGMVGLM